MRYKFQLKVEMVWHGTQDFSYVKSWPWISWKHKFIICFLIYYCNGRLTVVNLFAYFYKLLLPDQICFVFLLHLQLIVKKKFNGFQHKSKLCAFWPLRFIGSHIFGYLDIWTAKKGLEWECGRDIWGFPCKWRTVAGEFNFGGV